MTMTCQAGVATHILQLDTSIKTAVLPLIHRYILTVDPASKSIFLFYFLEQGNEAFCSASQKV